MVNLQFKSTTREINETRHLTEPQAVLRTALTVKKNTPEATYEGTLEILTQHEHGDKMQLKDIIVESADAACAYYYMIREAHGEPTITRAQIEHIHKVLSRVCQPFKATGPKLTLQDHPLSHEIPLLQLAVTGTRKALQQIPQPA